ncbi:hypothetical protein K449DRAFT_162137 [Hypoxylon sp. EC38]|nr:hypothetical protein K449DRAFT_162137 [Hypoxylon sp. EC38]
MDMQEFRKQNIEGVEIKEIPKKKKKKKKSRAQTHKGTYTHVRTGYMYMYGIIRIQSRSTLQSLVSAKVHVHAIRLGLPWCMKFLFFCLCLAWSYAADYHHTTNLPTVLGVWLPPSLFAAANFSASLLSFAFNPKQSWRTTQPVTTQHALTVGSCQVTMKAWFNH